MKKILFLTAVVTLLAATGCIVPVGEERGHSRHEDRSEVVVGPPVVVVHPPEVIVR